MESSQSRQSRNAERVRGRIHASEIQMHPLNARAKWKKAISRLPSCLLYINIHTYIYIYIYNARTHTCTCTHQARDSRRRNRRKAPQAERSSEYSCAREGFLKRIHGGGGPTPRCSSLEALPTRRGSGCRLEFSRWLGTRGTRGGHRSRYLRTDVCGR